MRQTLVTVPAGDKAFAEAVSCVHVTWAPSRQRAQRVTGTLQAAVWSLSQAVVSLSTVVAALSLHTGLTATLSCYQTSRHVCPAITHTTLQGARRVTATRFTDVGVSQVSFGVLVVEGSALLTLTPHGVVLTLITHSSTHVPRRQIHSRVKVT